VEMELIKGMPGYSYSLGQVRQIKWHVTGMCLFVFRVITQRTEWER